MLAWPLGKLKAAVRRAYGGASDDAKGVGNAIAFLGFTAADFDELPDDFGDVEIWPENRETWNLFTRLSTQWRTGMAGATGLDYNAAYPLLERMAVDKMDWWHLFDGLQACESEALAIFAERRKDETK